MSLEILKRPKRMLWTTAAKVLCQRLAVACQRKARKDDERVKRAAEGLGGHDETDGQDPKGDPIVATPEPDLYDCIAGILVDGGVVHDDEDVATCSRGVQCSLLVEEVLHELCPREPVEQEPLVPVFADDRDVVGLGPPAATDDEVGSTRTRKASRLAEKVAAHVALPSFPGSRDHHHHGAALVERPQVPSPSREHSPSLFDTPVYISLP